MAGNHGKRSLLQGQELDKITAYHPWDSEQEELVMNADHVTLDSGTGLVHTAPGFGEDDYNVGKNMVCLLMSLLMPKDL